MKKFFRIVLITGTVLLCTLYVLACLAPVVPADKWVVIGFLGLGFPVLFCALLGTIFIWFLVKRKIAFLLLLVALLGTYQVCHSVAFHNTGFSQEKKASNIRLLCWNVKNFTTGDIWHDPANSTRHRVFQYIDSQRADILCLQDFTQFENQYMPSNISMLADSMGFPYYVFSKDYEGLPSWGPEYAGVAIFSKYPLKNVQRIPYTGKRFPESVITADVTINNTTRRLVVTHLQSMHLKRLLLYEKKPWIRDEDSLINYSGTILPKLAFYLPYHAQQARQVRQVLDASPYPVIFSADMNEVPTSYCYREIRGNREDVFLKKGNGLGRTYYRISPTLRIDYVFTSPGIKVTQFKKDETGDLSDHYPQVLDIEW